MRKRTSTTSSVSRFLARTGSVSPGSNRLCLSGLGQALSLLARTGSVSPGSDRLCLSGLGQALSLLARTGSVSHVSDRLCLSLSVSDRLCLSWLGQALSFMSRTGSVSRFLARTGSVSRFLARTGSVSRLLPRTLAKKVASSRISDIIPVTHAAGSYRETNTIRRAHRRKTVARDARLHVAAVDKVIKRSRGFSFSLKLGCLFMIRRSLSSSIFFDMHNFGSNLKLKTSRTKHKNVDFKITDDV